MKFGTSLYSKSAVVVGHLVSFQEGTLPETNSKRPCKHHPFSGAFAVSFREDAPQKFNIDTKNDGLENASPFKYGNFRYCIYVSFQGGKSVFQNVPKRLSQFPKSSKVLTQTAFFFLDFGTGLVPK